MATPNSPFGPPAGGGEPTGAGAISLPPPVPPSDLDVKLGALLAEGSAGVTDSPEPHRRGVATLILGGALVIGAGLGLGWGIGRATRHSDSGTDSGPAITASPAPSGDSAPGGQTATGGVVSDAPPSADDTAVHTAVPSDDAAGSGVASAPPTALVAVPPAESTSVSATIATQPASLSTTPGPPVDATAPAGDPASGPSPTLATTPDEGPKLPPTAFAVLEGGRLTVRGTFADQAALDQAITALAPLGTTGLAVEAVVDPTIVGSRQVPVLVSDAALFQRGNAILGEGAQPVLDLFASAMAASPASRLIIEGHTDSQGSDAYNFALSQQRIAAVFAYLIGKGVDPARLELAPKGETEPVADNGTDEGRSRNRRVELIFAA